MQILRYGILSIFLSIPLVAQPFQQHPAPLAFSVDQIFSFPSPENLIASPVGSTIAWTFNERGVRNVYVADGPAFEPRRITPYVQDDGQELTQLSFSSDGKTVVYVRGGDHGSNRGGEGPPDPAGNPIQPRIQVWSVPAARGEPETVGGGGAPRPPLARIDSPWMILVADVESVIRDNPKGVPLMTAVTSGDKPVDPILQNPGGIGLRWAADDCLLFMSYRDGFPHLYSIQHPGRDSRPMLLTPGAFMVEQVTLTPDRRFIIYNANTGADRNDVDRRHLFKVPINAATPT